MKFGKRLPSLRVPRWDKHYIDYNMLKLRLYEGKLTDEDIKTHVDAADKFFISVFKSTVEKLYGKGKRPTTSEGKEEGILGRLKNLVYEKKNGKTEPAVREGTETAIILNNFI